MAYMTSKMIEWWTKFQPFTEDELMLREKLCSDNIDYSKITAEELPDYLSCQNQLFDAMPWTENIRNSYNFYFTPSCTAAIDSLFDKYVDDHTLVITTSLEHPSVLANLEKCKHVVVLDYPESTLRVNNSFIKRVHDKVSKHINDTLFTDMNKVFIYVVGTYVAYSNIHSNSMIQDLVNVASRFITEDNITTVLDDCQGMFLVPRDYSMFDFVLCTSHAITRLDSGIILSNKQVVGTQALEPISKLIERLQPVLDRRYKLSLFREIMSQYFDQYRGKFQVIEQDVAASHIFSMIDKDKLLGEEEIKLLEKYGIRVDGENTDMQILRFRAMHFLFFPEELLSGLIILEELLQEVY